MKNPNLFSRDEIVQSIDEDNDRWYTCVFKEKVGGKRVWEKGSRIHTVDIDDKKYIRTDRNKKDADNLGELPSVDKNLDAKKSYGGKTNIL